jgi:hypothetical protein
MDSIRTNIPDPFTDGLGLVLHFHRAAERALQIGNYDDFHDTIFLECAFLISATRAFLIFAKRAVLILVVYRIPGASESMDDRSGNSIWDLVFPIPSHRRKEASCSYQCSLFRGCVHDLFNFGIAGGYIFDAPQLTYDI